MRNWQLGQALALVALAMLAACGTAAGGGGWYAPVDGVATDGSDAVTTPDASTPTDTTADTGSGTDTAVEDVAPTDAVADDTAVADTAITDAPVADVAPEVSQPDATPDTVAVQDTQPDVPDVPPPVDAVQDMAPDVPNPPDVAPDTGPDLPTWPEVVDTTPDTAPDVAPGPCGPTGTIAALLGCPEGAIDFQLDNALVTYVFPSGFLLHDGSTTRGMMVYFSSGGWPFAKPKAGDVVSLHATKYGQYNGQQEIMAADALTVLGALDPAATALDLASASKDMLGEAYESRLLVGKGLVVKQLTGTDGIVTTPGAGDLVLRVDGTTKLCAGAVFELKAGALTQFGSGHRVHLMNGQPDLGAVDVSQCADQPFYDDSNWGFEEPDPSDPPPDFYKVGGGLLASRTTTQQHGGAASAKLTWTSQDNQDLVAGKLVAVAPGQTVTLQIWTLDTDPAGRARLGLTFAAADQTTLVKNEFAVGYSVDGPSWVLQTLAVPVPAGAAFVRGFTRLYDEKAWLGSATVYVDDWSLSVQ